MKMDQDKWDHMLKTLPNKADMIMLSPCLSFFYIIWFIYFPTSTYKKRQATGMILAFWGMDRPMYMIGADSLCCCWPSPNYYSMVQIVYVVQNNDVMMIQSFVRGRGWFHVTIIYLSVYDKVPQFNDNSDIVKIIMVSGKTRWSLGLCSAYNRRSIHHLPLYCFEYPTL